jgi:hypothetical protein
MGDPKIKNVIPLINKESLRNFFEYHVQINNDRETSIKIQGNSGTAIPTYHVFWLGTGKKFTSERIKRIKMRIKRTIVLF